MWEDDRAGAPDFYLQHVHSDGAVDFPDTGQGVCVAPGWQYLGGLLASPNGDAIVHWVDERSGYGDLFAQRIGPNGSARWASGGVPVCTAPRGQYRMTAATDDAGGAVFSWTDFRSGTERLIYSQRVDSSGFAQWSGNDVVPVLISLASVRASHDRVSIVWQIDGASRATVERSEDGDAWAALSEIDADGRGRIAFEDRAIAPGARYTYRIMVLADGVRSHGGEASVVIPTALAFALHGVSPNPAHGTIWQVAFSVASPGSARLQIVDVAGRIVAASELGELEPGEQVITLRGVPSTPGIYFLRLTQGTRTVTSRVVAARK